MVTTTTRAGRRAGAAAPSLVLFAVLLAVQSPQFVLAPLLADTADALGTSVAAAGQVRALAGLVAAVAAAFIGPIARRMPLRDLVALSVALVVVGSVAAALATGLAGLAFAHLFLGAGLGIGLTTGLTGARVWAGPGQHRRVLSHALMGPPAAAVVGSLVAGLLGGIGWRVAWLVPATVALLALGAVCCRPREGRPAIPVTVTGGWRLASVPGWLVGELLAYAAWSVVIVFSGALLVQSYRASTARAGLAIAASAAAFIVGNRLVRRSGGDVRSIRRLLVQLAPALALSGLLFGAVRQGYAASAGLLLLLGLLQGARTHLGSAFGLLVSAGRPVEVMALRTAAQQLGYLVGGSLGGLVLTTAGYSGLGVLVAVLVVAAATPHAWSLVTRATGAPQGAERSTS